MPFRKKREVGYEKNNKDFKAVLKTMFRKKRRLKEDSKNKKRF